MVLSLSRASLVIGDDTQDILEFSPDPAHDLQPLLSYARINAAFRNFAPLADRPSTVDMFNKTFLAHNSGNVGALGFLFGDEDFSRAVTALTDMPGKVTSISSSGGATPLITTLTSSPYIRDVRDVFSLSSGLYVSLFNANHAWLDDWFYPSPTHAVLGVGNIGMTSAAPTMTQAYLQCQPYNARHMNSSPANFDILQYGPQGSRLANLGWQYKVGTTERRYKQAIWDRSSVLWGAPPDLEVWGYALFSKPSGVGSFPSCTADILLRKTAIDGTTADTALSSTALTIDSAYTIAGTDYQFQALQPTSTASGTPSADTEYMQYFPLGVTITGGSDYTIMAQDAGAWHKTPCFFSPWAFSHGSGDNAYLPGWLIDMT